MSVVGHTLQKTQSSVTKQALEWNPQEKRKMVCTKQTRRQSPREKLKDARSFQESIE
uniref:Uncharacterized protein n=1 Tax=Arion vulgaris TaxID=1028688 RepID=A0A0B6Y900_9EUPU